MEVMEILQLGLFFHPIMYLSYGFCIFSIILTNFRYS